MSRLSTHKWLLKYTPDEGDLAKIFYEIALGCAFKYERLTGYFDARVLTIVSRGIEGLVRNNGKMRLVVGCTLGAEEVAAIERGEALRDTVERCMLANPLAPSDQNAIDALELLAWMVANGYLEVKVSVPCDEKRRPIPAEGIFHEKSGIIEDSYGDRIAFTGSNNETRAGWEHNWESFHVFASWREPERVIEEESSFARVWSDSRRMYLPATSQPPFATICCNFFPRTISPLDCGVSSRKRKHRPPCPSRRHRLRPPRRFRTQT